jgi:hypothetical protein
MGKTAPHEKSANDFLKLARAMYAQQDSQLGDNAIVQTEPIQSWMNRLLDFAPQPEAEKK